MICPVGSDRGWSDIERGEASRAGQAAGWWTAEGGPGPAVGDLIGGGHQGIRWESRRGGALLANQQGGFRVDCPAVGGTVVPAFNKAMQGWRTGGPRALMCPCCGASHDLDLLQFRPPAAFAVTWLRLVEVGDVSPAAAATEVLVSILGPLRVIGQRVG